MKSINRSDATQMWQNKQGRINHVNKDLKKGNILIIEKWNITKFTDAVFPESHSV